MVVGEITVGTEVLVIGGGPGGYHAADCAARLGKDVTLVEAGPLGGVCLHAGCIPSKALIQGAKQGKAPYLSGSYALDFPALQQWKGEVIARLERGVAQTLKQADVKVVHGHARFTGPDRALVVTAHGTETYRFSHCIIATGSRPAQIRGLEPDGSYVVDSTGALSLPEVPAEFVVLGGGYIGLELGTAYAKLGSQVTVIEAMERLLPGMDPDLGRTVERRLKKLGVTVHLRSHAVSWRAEQGKAIVTANVDQQEIQIAASRLLVAVGRRPNTEELGLSAAGITVGEAGFIRTDHACRTGVPHIFAIGDVAEGPMLAHKATKEAEVAAEAILGQNAAMDAVAIPAVVFTDPEVASVGLTEAEARERGSAVATGRASMAANGRAWILQEAEGFVKVVADAETGLLLGVQMAGPEVSELIAEATLALEMGARVTDLADTIHAHPTLSETLMAAAKAVRRV